MPSDEVKRIAVIGAGPAGLAASLSALEEGAQVLVLEHMAEAGKKLLITGNGACNFTNTSVSPEHYHGSPEVVESVLKSCSWEDLNRFFASLGIPSTEEHYRFEACGYLYPRSRKAADVRDAFLRRIRELGGELVCDCQIASVLPVVEAAPEADNGREAKEHCCYRISTDRGSYDADAVVFATGSNAFPATGSDSSIYPVLKQLGISQKPWLPALCAIKSSAEILKTMAGLRCDAKIALFDETTGEKWTAPAGEVQFREHYVSGLPAMQLSRYAAIGTKQKHEMKLELKLLSANNKDHILPVRELKLAVTGTEGFEHSVCCSGGVEGSELNPDTLEAKRIPHVFFAGELIDVDGDCGGFNLHFAFASGLLAGRNAAK